MRKRFILLLIATLALMSVNARQISEQEAQLKAEKFFGKQGQNHSNMRRAPRKAPKLILASNREELYIFNDKANGGYIVISGDDRMPDVLAYSYDGIYDDNEIPCNMKAWMDDYAGQVAYLKTHPEAKVKRQTVTERKNINPLLTCWFGQGAPYNNKCPEVDGVRCPTGCVATAMAQIMYYYQWPKQTTEVIPGYTTYTLGISIPEQPITTIDWNNIRGEYWNEYSNEEADAVSTLMMLCGKAVEMEYTPNGSGAGSPDKALRKYFNYDELLDVISRGGNTDKWESMIYEELYCGRPIIYSGYSEILDAGHTFVMDGYEGGYFHVNWGWGGVYSYVLMTDVGGFNKGQSAIVGIQPQPANPDYPCRYAVYDNGKMTLYYDTEKEHRSGIVISHKDDWVNYANDITTCVIDPSFAKLKQRNLTDYFYKWNHLKSIDGIENFRTDNVTDMRFMFYGCSSLTSLDLSSFNTDNVTDMRFMFYGCSSLASLNLSGFKTDNVMDMTCMFYSCSSLTSLDVSGFNTDNVMDMGSMFDGCSSLTSLDVSGFKTDNVKDMGSMFDGCSSLTSLDVSGFKTDNVTNMGSMFSLCSGLTSLDVSGFNTDNVMYMGFMFNDCSSLTSLDVSGFKTDNVKDMTCMFYRCLSLTNLDVSGFKTDNVTRMHDMFRYCSGLTSLDVKGFKTDKVTDMGGMFDGCSELTNLDVGGFKTDNVTNMSGMFEGCSNLTSLDLSSFKTGNVTDMNSMFYDCTNLTSLDLSSFKTDNVTNMSRMFYYCSSLTSLDVSGFNTDKVDDMNNMFYYCIGLTSVNLSGFKTDNVINMSKMFSYCRSLTSLDLSSFKTGNVMNMGYMFSGCSNLKKIFVSQEWSTNNVISGDNMFLGCPKLMGGAGTRYTLNHWDYTYAHIDGGMDNPGYFRDKNLPDFDPYALLSEDNTILTFYYDDQMEARGGRDVYEQDWSNYSSDITTVVFDESFAGFTTLTSTANWFSGCSKLESIVGIDNLRTDNVTDMSRMFYGCSSLTNIDLSSFKTDNVTNMYGMFSECSSLKKIFVSAKWSITNVKSGDNMFYGCSKLIGGVGTIYDWGHCDYTYAHIDGGMDNPGYFRDENLPDFDPYALLSEDNTILTFYYDDHMEARGGMNLFYGLQWNNYSGDITTVVFDDSFVGFTMLTSTVKWFSGCSKLKSIVGIDNLRTDNVTDMSRMFFGCSSLTSLDLSSFKIDNVTNMSRMFYRCSSLTNLDLNSFKSAVAVTNMREMFYGCSSLTSLDLSNFKTNNVMDMSGMFGACSCLTSLDLNNFKTDNVTDMGGMFGDCSSLTILDLSCFKTDNVTNMSSMFSWCEKLKKIYVGAEWTSNNVTSGANMFYACSQLIGGAGTLYDWNHHDNTYAHIDGGVSNPGYLTYKDYYYTLIYMVDGEEYKSYRLEIGEEITPEPKPTKDGYVFLGWDNIPATMPDYDVVVNGTFYLYGDVNTDKDVDVLDVVDIARYVVEIPSESFVKQLADINKDGNVNLGDAVTLVNEIAGEQNFVRAKASPKDNYTNDVLSLTEWNGCLSLNLQNERYYTAFQFDLYVPEGSDVTQMSLNTKRKQGHQLLYNRVKDGHYRVAALSTSNNEFIGNDGELLIVALNGLYNDEVSIRHIHFFDVKGNDYLFDDIEGSNTTSLTPSLSKGEGDDIYDLQGRKRLALQRGVNIVGGKKVVIK